MPDYRNVAIAAARRNGIDPNLFVRQINQESGFNPNARSSAGAIGIAQIVPKYHPGVDVTNPVASLNYAAHLMGTLYKQYGNYQQALSVYNSGKPDTYKDPGFASGQTFNYVKSIMGGATPSATPVNPVARPVPLTGASVPGVTAPQRPVGVSPLSSIFKLGNEMVGLPSRNLLPLPVAPPAAQPFTPTPLPFTGAPLQTRTLPLTKGAWKAGLPVVNMTSEGGVHPTEGLAGFPAHDYFAPAGSRVVAPITGTVIRLSGHDPAMGPIQGPHGPLGWSVYIKGSDGKTYYMTHMGSRNVHVGETLRAGQPIGTVANYAKYGTPSHIHMGVN